MSTELYRNLAWLPPAPEGFNALCRGLASGEDVGRRARALAQYALDANQLARLAARLDAARDGGALAPLVPFRLGLIGNGTLDFIAPAICASAARHGIALDCIKAEYGQTIQEALAPDSAINRARPDAVLVALDYRGLPLRAVPGNAAEAQAEVDLALAHLQAIRTGFRENAGAICILQTLAPPPEGLFGSFDRALPGTARHLIDRVNLGLADAVFGSDDLLLDVAGLAETVGLAEWHSPAQWNMAKLPFDDAYLPLYADHVARLVAALRGKSRRCLVLDLDNTMWGGVIGDDGLDGIRIAQGDATGEAHLAVQRLALDLRARGIVLAVSSKNTDSVARAPFREHPEMLVREDHIAVFQANWDDKASNITAIADTLALGLESFVFLDDNRMERDLVRRMLPQVAVPELPDDPALYARTLAAAGYFEAVAFSAEDRRRAEFYQDNARRVELQSQAGDIGAYLASLDMEITFQPFDAVGRARIVQLIAKSNQFNLTTRRYTEPEIAAVERDPDCFTLQVRLADRFGDNGMICVVICRRTAETSWEIDTWLMSCRVLGRGVEQMVLREILFHAREAGMRAVVGVYCPTERNRMVRDHYAKLGFAPIASRADGTTLWQLDVDTPIEGAPMTIRRVGLALAAG